MAHYSLRGTERPRAPRMQIWISWIWALLPLAFALPAPVTFGWASYRLRSRALAAEAVAYLAACVAWVTLANQADQSLSDTGSVLAVITAAIACGHSIVIRRRVFEPASAAPMAAEPVPTPAASVAPTWTPTFPAQQAERDPNNPATWIAAVACTGSDRHQLSVPLQQTVWAGASGAAVIGLDVHFHVYGRGLGAGIGLLLLPIVSALFNRWVDGPVLYYRTWGRLHQLRLDQVTAVDAGGTRGTTTSIALAVPGLASPVRLSLRSRGYVMPRAARDHLRGWLSSPAVQWSPQARFLFDAHASPTTQRSRQRHRVLAVALGVVLPIVVVAAGVVLVLVRSHERDIAGASGYHRFGGPHGKFLAVGRPWGHPCQPVRLSVESHVPDWIYQQVLDVVDEARRDGINVTLETRDFQWAPSSVYYPPGGSATTVPRVAVFADGGDPPPLDNGMPRHLSLGWDATLDPDGHHEDVTYAQGTLWLQTIDGQAEAARRSVRYLIALTQGIISTSRTDSGIGSDLSVDEFTPADVAAMQVMSGCNGAATAVVSQTPAQPASPTP